MEVRVFRRLAVIGTLTGALVATPASAQRSGVTVQGVVEGDIVEGLVSRADRQAGTIVPDNGQEYLVPRALEVDWDAVRPGVAVRLRYSVDGGRSIATAVQLRS